MIAKLLLFPLAWTGNRLLDWIAGPPSPHYHSRTVPPRHPMKHHDCGCDQRDH
jgi:hypothetical protein